MSWREVEHTADWAIEVVAGNIDELFLEAARGLYGLAGCELGDVAYHEEFEVDGIDSVTLLVAFLDELLYLLDVRHVAFESIVIERDAEVLRASASGRNVTSLVKTIKAVTFHDLDIVQRADGQWTATIVVDV